MPASRQSASTSPRSVGRGTHTHMCEGVASKVFCPWHCAHLCVSASGRQSVPEYFWFDFWPDSMHADISPTHIRRNSQTHSLRVIIHPFNEKPHSVTKQASRSRSMRESGKTTRIHLEYRKSNPATPRFCNRGGRLQSLNFHPCAACRWLITRRLREMALCSKAGMLDTHALAYTMYLRERYDSNMALEVSHTFGFESRPCKTCGGLWCSFPGSWGSSSSSAACRWFQSKLSPVGQPTCFLLLRSRLPTVKVFESNGVLWPSARS